MMNEVEKSKDEVEKKLKYVERAWYEIVIAAILAKSTRLEAHNQEISVEIKYLEERLMRIVAESDENIRNLKKQHNSEQRKLKTEKNKLESLQNVLSNSKNSHEAKVHEINEKFEQKRVELLSKYKFFEAKINYLMDFKRVQEDLEEMYRGKEEILQENEEELKIFQQKINLQARLDCDDLKLEAKKGLLKLSSLFHQKIDEIIDQNSKRLMKETLLLKKFQEALISAIGNQETSRVCVESKAGSILSYRKQITTRLIQRDLESYMSWLNEKTKIRLTNIKSIGEIPKSLANLENQWTEEILLNAELSRETINLQNEKMKILILRELSEDRENNLKKTLTELYTLRYSLYCILNGFCECNLEKYRADIKDLLFY